MELSRSRDKDLEQNLKRDARENVRSLLIKASNYANILKHYRLSEKQTEKENFLSSEIFERRAEIDKPFQVYIKEQIDVVVVPVGSSVEGTNISGKPDFDYLVVLDIKSDATPRISSKSVNDPCFLRVDTSDKLTDFPLSMQKKFFHCIDKSYNDLRKDHKWKDRIKHHQDDIKKLPARVTVGYDGIVVWNIPGNLFNLFVLAIKWLTDKISSTEQSTYTDQPPRAQGPASTLEFIYKGENGKYTVQYTIDLVPTVLVNNTSVFLKSEFFTENKQLRSAFRGIGSFFVVQRRGSDEYMGAFNLSELKLMDHLKSRNTEAYNAYLCLKKIKENKFSCNGKDCEHAYSYMEPVVSSYVLKTLVLKLAVDESCAQMTESAIVFTILKQLKNIVNPDSEHMFLQHLWFPCQNVFDLKQHHYEKKHLSHLEEHIDDILRKEEKPSSPSKL